MQNLSTLGFRNESWPAKPLTEATPEPAPLTITVPFVRGWMPETDPTKTEANAMTISSDALAKALRRSTSNITETGSTQSNRAKDLGGPFATPCPTDKP